MPTYRMVVRTTAPGMPGPGYSTFHWRSSAVPIAADLAAAAIALRDAYAAMATVQGSSVVHFFDGRFVEVNGDALLTAPVWSQPGTSGATASDALSPALCVVITWRTTSNSRSGRGRTFLSGWREGNNDASGTPGLSELVAVTNMAAELVAFNAETGNGAFVVWSPTDGLARDIVQGTVSDQWAVLRSRRD